jgi:hypothetical protein
MPTLSVELQKSHTHAGTLLEPGDVIELPADLARWLCESGIARPHKAELKPPRQPSEAKLHPKTEEST